MPSPTKHALLSASSATVEGTAAHALAEYKGHRALGDLEFPRFSSDYQCDEMELLTDDYTSYVMEQYTRAKKFAKDSLIKSELKLYFSKYVPKEFGTGDRVIVSDHLLHIIDFKYGKGVKVITYDNPQMKLYALGSLTIFGNLYNIGEVKTTIF